MDEQKSRRAEEEEKGALRRFGSVAPVWRRPKRLVCPSDCLSECLSAATFGPFSFFSFILAGPK